MISLKSKYLAILGFADYCSEHNKDLAQQVAQLAAQHGVGLCMGNTTGTFHYALKELKYFQGNSLVVLERGYGLVTPYCKNVVMADNTDIKHLLVANACMAAIVIGGGLRTEHLADCILQQGKPVVVMAGCGGTINKERHPSVRIITQVEEAFKSILAA